MRAYGAYRRAVTHPAVRIGLALALIACNLAWTAGLHSGWVSACSGLLAIPLGSAIYLARREAAEERARGPRRDPS